MAPGEHGQVIFAINLNLDVGSGVTVTNVALIGTETDQLETESRNNQDNANIVIQAPTDLPEGPEPEKAFSLRFYLPLATK